MALNMLYPKCGNQNVFDAECYMARYPDMEAIIDKHYAYHGQYENRQIGTDANPNEYNVQAYLHKNPDLNIFLQEHWEQHGQYEGRVPGCDACATEAPTGEDPAEEEPATNNKTLIWLAVGAGLLFFAHQQKLFK